MTLLKEDTMGRPLGSESRLCVGSREHEDGSLNGRSRLRDQALGSVGQG